MRVFLLKTELYWIDMLKSSQRVVSEGMRHRTGPMNYPGVPGGLQEPYRTFRKRSQTASHRLIEKQY